MTPTTLVLLGLVLSLGPCLASPHHKGFKSKGKSKGKGHRYVLAPTPIPAPPLVVQPHLVPGPPPCAPVVKHVTVYTTKNNYVPVYSTQVEEVLVPTTIYDIRTATISTTATQQLDTTLYQAETRYEESVSVGTQLVTVTQPRVEPQVTTVTNIQLSVAPSLVTQVQEVTRASVSVAHVDVPVTRTTRVYAEYTQTATIPVPVVVTQTVVETVAVPVTTTVTVTAAGVPPPPKSTATVVETDVHYTPAFVTKTYYETHATTVTRHESFPATVTVQAPCGYGY